MTEFEKLVRDKANLSPRNLIECRASHIVTVLDERDATIAALRAENEKLTAALKHYADKQNWSTVYYDDAETGLWVGPGNTCNGYEIACEVLAELEKKQP